MKDINGIKININDKVMYIDPEGREYEGIITNIIDTDKINIHYESGFIIVHTYEVYHIN